MGGWFDAGTVKIGAGVWMVTLDQKARALGRTATLRQPLTGSSSGMVGDAVRRLAGYMKGY